MQNWYLDLREGPGVKSSFNLLLRALFRKLYINQVIRFRKIMVNRRFKKIQRKIDIWCQKSDTSIPKILHYIWVGGNEKPEDVKNYINSWSRNCPDYLVIEWSERNYDVSKNRYMLEAYFSKRWAFVTDFMRLDILDMFGGVYVDSDLEILKNIDIFLDDPAFTSFETGDPSQVLMPTGIMGSTKGNEWIRYLKKYYDNGRQFILSDGRIDVTPNTNTITSMTKERYSLVMNNKKQRFKDFIIYPSEVFCPKSWSTGKINLTSKTHTIHHFAGSWKKDLPPNYKG